MGRLQRMYSEEGMYFVTARTFQGRALLTPSQETTEVVAGILAKAASMVGVELHAFVVVSNHLHLLVTAKGASLSSFMSYLLGNISRKVGRLINWKGCFWERRFSAAPVLDDSSAEERPQYILSHGVKEGLVRTPQEWPGLSCVELLLQGGQKAARFFHWAKRWKKGVLREGASGLLSDQWAENVVLRLVLLPSWRGLSAKAVRRKTKFLLKELSDRWRKVHQRVLGVRAIRATTHADVFSSLKKTAAPACHTASPEMRTHFLETRRAFVSAFSMASKEFAQGNLEAAFPPWAFRPSSLVNRSFKNRLFRSLFGKPEDIPVMSDEVPSARHLPVVT
jgi:REP element-mobilizing transposase RayT